MKFDPFPLRGGEKKKGKKKRGGNAKLLHPSIIPARKGERKIKKKKKKRTDRRAWKEKEKGEKEDSL